MKSFSSFIRTMFLGCALLIICLRGWEWIYTGVSEFYAVTGWVCAVMWCMVSAANEKE